MQLQNSYNLWLREVPIADGTNKTLKIVIFFKNKSLIVDFLIYKYVIKDLNSILNSIQYVKTVLTI